MNCELVFQEDFDRARTICHRSNDRLHEAISILLESKSRYLESGSEVNGVNGSDLLSSMCKLLIDDPHLALCCHHSASIADIRRSYKRMALNYHPDKNRFTSQLFQIIQSAYMTLAESPAANDDRKQNDSHPGVQPTFHSPAKARPCNPPPPARETGPAKYARVPPMDPSLLQKGQSNPFHSFNKQFFTEYIRASKQGAYNKFDTGINANENAPVAAQSKESGPPRPQNIRCTHRSSTSVTVEWKGCGFARSTAYEVQWRSKNDQSASSVSPWHTASQFVLSTKCKKNNLIPNTRYEFRIRAASAWGWSLHSDILTICTLTDLNPQQFNSCQPPAADCDDDERWECTVCKRQSSASESSCRTCGAVQGYVSPKINPDLLPPSLNTGLVGDDDHDDEETWDYDPVVDQDLDVRIFALVKSRTTLHNVRIEPRKSSPVIGLLFSDKEIHVFADSGEWLKVEYHERFRDENDASVDKDARKLGWCLSKNNSGQEFLSLDAATELHQRSSSTVNNSCMFWWSQKFSTNAVKKDLSAINEGVVRQEKEAWYELRDETGELYYFNSLTGESKWEQPAWVDYMDESTSSVYYFNTITHVSSWDVPDDFVPIIREEAYSTPEATFAKTVLSPKRSNGVKSNKSPV